jgi:hypothetical protein
MQQLVRSAYPQPIPRQIAVWVVDHMHSSINSLQHVPKANLLSCLIADQRLLATCGASGDPNLGQLNHRT